VFGPLDVLGKGNGRGREGKGVEGKGVGGK